MASKCKNCGDTKNYDFVLNIGLCSICIGDRLERFENGLEKLQQWAKAYPLGVFPEPDFKQVREALALWGISLDAVSASNKRHVLKGVTRIVDEALGDTEKKGE